MYRLTDDDLDTIQAYLDKASVEFSEVGLTLHTVSNTGNWIQFMETAPGIVRINTTYDPRYSNTNSENRFWIYLKNRADQIVGYVCSRCFDIGRDLMIRQMWENFFADSCLKQAALPAAQEANRDGDNGQDTVRVV